MNSQTILLVYAHPDDESFGPAATVARYSRYGVRTCLVCATRGEKGSLGSPPVATPETLGAVREQELRCAAAALGIREIQLLNYRDGELDRVEPHELKDRVLDQMRRVKPRVVITFGPHGITGHPDHIAIHRATTDAFHLLRGRPGGPKALFYNAVSPEVADRLQLSGAEAHPNTAVPVDGFLSAKIEALRCHQSQTDAQEMARDLEKEPQTVELFFQAWPPVPTGEVVTDLLESPG